MLKRHRNSETSHRRAITNVPKSTQNGAKMGPKSRKIWSRGLFGARSRQGRLRERWGGKPSPPKVIIFASSGAFELAPFFWKRDRDGKAWFLEPPGPPEIDRKSIKMRVAENHSRALRARSFNPFHFLNTDRPDQFQPLCRIQKLVRGNILTIH